MGARGVLRTLDGGRVGFMCPGCEGMHQLRVEGDGRPRWGFNGDYDRPTFTPSVLVTWSEPSDVEGGFDDRSKDRKIVCHSFVTDGQISFLGDCTHALRGQVVPLQPIASAEP